jgi:hypothetical protein
MKLNKIIVINTFVIFLLVGCWDRNHRLFIFDYNNNDVKMIFNMDRYGLSTYSRSDNMLIDHVKYYSNILEGDEAGRVLVYAAKSLVFEKPVLIIESSSSYSCNFRVIIPLTREQLAHGAKCYYDFSIGRGIYECFLEKNGDGSPFSLKVLKSRSFYDRLKKCGSRVATSWRLNRKQSIRYKLGTSSK